MEFDVDQEEFARQYGEVIDVPDPDAVTEATWDIYRALRTYDEVRVAIRAARDDLGIDLGLANMPGTLQQITDRHDKIIGHARYLLQKHNLSSDAMQRSLSWPGIWTLHDYFAREIVTGSPADGPQAVMSMAYFGITSNSFQRHIDTFMPVAFGFEEPRAREEGIGMPYIVIHPLAFDIALR